MNGITSSSFEEFKKEDEELLTMSLSTRLTSPVPHLPSHQFSFLPSLPLSSPPPQPPSSPPSPSHNYMSLFSSPPTSYLEVRDGRERQYIRPSRARRLPVQALPQGKSETVPALYPWATTHRAVVYSLEYLLVNGINKITGEVQCKRCEQKYEIEYDLQQKFMEIASFISENKCSMHDRAPDIWMNPNLPSCKFCEQNNCVKPLLAERKKSINWLFLLLGQMLGCCRLAQLKYFCKHTKNHRTGAKDRVLYLTYLGLCKQIDPNGPFDL